MAQTLKLPTANLPEPPEHLSDEMADWWREVVAEWRLEAHQLRLLRLACEAWDRCQEAREVLDEEGLTMYDRFDQEKPRPEIAVERDSRLAFARLLREINLDIGPNDDDYRPPRVKGR